MKKLIVISIFTLSLLFTYCKNAEQKSATADTTENESATPMGQAGVQDDISQKDIVKTAVGSKDHTTLVAALTQADYVDDLSNAGPFTVFAPTNDAFNALPPGTVDNLMKADQKSALQNILEYHVAVGVYKEDYLQDGQSIGMANGNNITIHIANGKMTVNDGINIIASIPTSNGLIYVTDKVLLPPAK